MGFLRKKIKDILKKFLIIDCYCKKCGIKIYDFKVDDIVWIHIMGYNNTEELCYNCFCKKGTKKGENMVMYCIPDWSWF